MSFLCTFFNFTILLFNVSWFNTKIDLPLDSDINNYLTLVKADIYEDGILISDAKVNYRFDGVNHTFLSTIQTSYVKVYTVYVEAYFETQDVKSVARIEFNVYDPIKPEITFIPPFVVNYPDKMPDFKVGLEYGDNYDQKEELTVFVDTSSINPLIIGDYEIIYHIKDKSNNENTYTHMIRIVDRKAPEIKLKKPIVIDVYSKIEINDFISVVDNYDQSVRIKVLDDEVDYNQLGEYEIKVIAIDLSKNQSFGIFLVKVLDLSPPEIVLKSYPEPISVYQEITNDDLKSYILSISDNFDTLSLDDVIITHDIDISRIGTYTVYYECVDSSLNSVRKTIKIDVVDFEKPELEIVIPFVFEVFSPSPILREHINVYDNYSDSDDLVVNIQTSYNINKIGRYDLKIEVSDKQKNKTTLHTFIEVVDLLPPEIIQVSDIMITDFLVKDLSIYFKATDQYDLDKTIITLDDHLVNYEQKGTYDLIVYAYDQSHNQSYLETKVHLIDITNPILNLKTDHIFLNIGEHIDDYSQYVLNVSDNYDVLELKDVTIINHVDYNLVGCYEVKYILIDSSLNETIKTINLYVDDMIAPTISGDDISISMYESIDFLKGLLVLDNVGIYKIYYEPISIDTSYPGSYEITYIAQDIRGNTSQFTRKLYIKEDSDTYEIKQFVPIIITLVTSISILYYLYKKQ